MLSLLLSVGKDGDGIFEGTIDVDSQTPTQYQILMVQGQWSSPIIVRNVLGLSAIPLYVRLLELLVLSRR